jgi:2,4-dienoyl-CoA reductase-like NADH-dependent reductase (Old Yellow Enzyme family)
MSQRGQIALTPSQEHCALHGRDDTTVAITGRGYLGAPGIYSDEQVAGWKKVVDAIHAKGGRMFLQLWHVGRVAHVDMTGGEAPVGPSVVPFAGTAYTKNGWVPVSPHRALKIEEIPGLIEQYREGARRARAAGFDGVEIHSTICPPTHSTPACSTLPTFTTPTRRTAGRERALRQLLPTQ